MQQLSSDERRIGAAAGLAESRAEPVGASSAPWSPAGRLAFRFLAVYILLFLQWGPVLSIPFPKLDAWNTANWNALTVWVARRVWHVAVDVSAVNTGSGDTKAQWVQTSFCLAFALLAALVWSIVDRKRPSYDRLYEWLRVYVRYMLFFELATYGLIKIIPSQFGVITPDKLQERIGDSTPMGLLWTFMAASTPYTIFGGVMELVSGLLLTLRRTTLLGALMTCAVMTNVFMLNMCYDVPVKLLSGQLLLLGVFLLAPDARRLVDILLLGRAAAAVPQRRLFRSPMLERAACLLGALMVVAFLTDSVDNDIRQRKMIALDASPTSKTPVSGMWDVDSFQDAAAVSAWTTFEVVDTQYGPANVVTLTTGKQLIFRTLLDTQAHRIRFQHRRAHPTHYAFQYRMPSDQELILTGTHDGAPASVRLHRDHTIFPLTHTRFHWINERPNNL